jgi:hypothetical protein
VLEDAALSIDPTEQDFGSSPVGVTGDNHLFTVTNTGGVATGTINTTLAGTHPADFPVDFAGDTCLGESLAPTASCNIVLEFVPNDAGARTALLQVSATPGGTATSTLSGTGTTAAELSIDPDSHDFGSVTSGSQSTSNTFVVVNIGQETSGVPNVQISGTNFTEFAIVTNGCTSAIEGTSDCLVEVRFEPEGTAGPRSATLEVNASPGGYASAALTGTAQ